MTVYSGAVERPEDTDPELAAECGFNLLEGLPSFGILAIRPKKDEVVVEVPVFKSTVFLNGRMDDVRNECGTAFFATKGCQFFAIGCGEKGVEQMQSIEDEGKLEGTGTVKPVAKPLGDFYLWVFLADGFKGLGCDGLGMPKQKDIGMNFPAGFDEGLIGFCCSKALAVGPTELAPDVMNRKGVDVVAVLAQSLMDLLIHSVVFVAAFIVMEITGVHNAQTGGFSLTHISLRPFLARWISYILTSLSHRLEAITAAQAKP